MDFIVSITPPAVVGDCAGWKDLDGFDPASYDLAILSDGRPDRMKAISTATGIPKAKLMRF